MAYVPNRIYVNAMTDIVHMTRKSHTSVIAANFVLKSMTNAFVWVNISLLKAIDFSIAQIQHMNICAIRSIVLTAIVTNKMTVNVSKVLQKLITVPFVCQKYVRMENANPLMYQRRVEAQLFVNALMEFVCTIILVPASADTN